ncbi:MAG: hypothetical protein J2P30_06645 [Actinobacteria bacterium]|nr:hypothetical protein [Actinomycetota bacterium]
MTGWYRVRLPMTEARALARGVDVEPGEVRYAGEACGEGTVLLDMFAVLAMSRRPEGDWSVSWRGVVPVLSVGHDEYSLEEISAPAGERVVPGGGQTGA